MGFKSVHDKPYTKADYYREMEERQAAKIAAKAAPVVVVPVQEPEWLEPENIVKETIPEEIVIPFVEPVAVVSETKIDENIAAPIPQEEEKPVKVSKQKRKKTG
jgi:hypothetical protein